MNSYRVRTVRRLVIALTIAFVLPFAAGCVEEPSAPDSSGTPPKPQPSLWTVSGSTSAILGLDPTRFYDTTPYDAGIVITTSSVRLNTLASVAFDTAGTLWVVGQDEPILTAFTRDALESSGSKEARTIIPTDGTVRSPTGLAFDSQQRLWVADFSGTLNRFDVAQLASGGVQRPAVVVNVPGNALAIAFDADGSLWVSDNIQNVIRKFTAAQLSTSGTPTPDVVLTASGLSLVNPAGLAFDSEGNLWVANIGGRTLSAFTPAQLSRTGSPTPNVSITSTGGALSVPVALAFDADGNLWVIGGTGALTSFSRPSLGASGPAVPTIRAQVAGRSLFWNIAFWPIPDGLPLGQRSTWAISRFTK